MNLKLKRLVRTQHSEQYALFDLSQLDAQQQPMTIGKLDLHYTGEGIYGTILLWDELSRRLRPNQRQKFIQAGEAMVFSNDPRIGDALQPNFDPGDQAG